MSENLKNGEGLLSIVIPCKNEVEHIGKLLDSLLNQNIEVKTIPIIIADAGSIDGTLDLINSYKSKLNITIVEGGLPAKARNNGARICTTEFVLFIDADVQLENPNLISNALFKATKNNLSCLGAMLSSNSDNPLDHVILFWISSIQFFYLLNMPFGVTTFLLFDRKYFWELGGFNEDLAIHEDAELTAKIKPSRFGLLLKPVKTSPRRLSKLGYLGFFKFSFRIFLNQNNPEYFKQHHGYWD